jgi:hypothetical protein
MFLGVEKNIEASLVEMIKLEGKWKLTEHGHLLQVERMNFQNLDIKLVLLESRIEKHEDWLL